MRGLRAAQASRKEVAMRIKPSDHMMRIIAGRLSGRKDDAGEVLKQLDDGELVQQYDELCIVPGPFRTTLQLKYRGVVVGEAEYPWRMESGVGTFSLTGLRGVSGFDISFKD
jgi:hypothetical protein